MLFRTFLVWTVGFLLTVILFIPIPIATLFDRTGRAAHRIASVWTRVILFLGGVRVVVTGLEKIDRKRPYLLVANHQEAFDIPVILGHLPLQFKWISKKFAFKYPFVGWTMYMAGYIKLDRTNPRAAYRALEEAGEWLERGFSVFIFPEGGRSMADKVESFKRGPFLLGIKAGVPIVPISIRGTLDVLKKGVPWICPATVNIRIEEPVSTEGLEEKEARELMKRVEGIVKESFEKNG